MSNTDTRYPYTYAADYVRSLAGFVEHGTKLSRSEASQIRVGIASAIGMDDAELARNLADHYKTKKTEIDKQSVAAYLAQTLKARAK